MVDMIKNIVIKKNYGEINWSIDDKSIYKEFTTAEEAKVWGSAYYQENKRQKKITGVRHC